LPSRLKKVGTWKRKFPQCLRWPVTTLYVSTLLYVFILCQYNPHPPVPMQLLFRCYATSWKSDPILTLTQIDTTSMRKALHLFEGGVYLSKMGKLGVPSRFWGLGGWNVW
jgi:hypothetical protein